VSFAAYPLFDVVGVVVDKVLGEAVDGLVGEVHHEVGVVGLGWLFLLGGTESEETVTVQEHPQRVNRGH